MTAVSDISIDIYNDLRFTVITIRFHSRVANWLDLKEDSHK